MRPSCSAGVGKRPELRRYDKARERNGKRGNYRTTGIRGSCRRARTCRRGWPGSRDRIRRARVAKSRRGQSPQRHKWRAPKSTRVQIASWQPRDTAFQPSLLPRTSLPATAGKAKS